MKYFQVSFLEIFSQFHSAYPLAFKGHIFSCLQRTEEHLYQLGSPWCILDANNFTLAAFKTVMDRKGCI